MLHRLRSRWSALNEWLRALLLAFVVLGFVHVFLLRFVSVRSTSMYATLLPGDLVAVTRWNTWSGLQRGDIAVFRDPIQDDRAMPRRQLLIKRVAGMPGDTVQLVESRLFVNRERVEPFEGETHSHLVRLKKDADPVAVLNDLGLPPAFVPPGRSFIELPLNKAMAKAITERSDVVGAERMSSATGAPRHIFPFSPNYRWNTDDYGPLVVPRRGDTVRVNVATIALYDRIISRYEGHDLKNQGNELLIDGVVADRYVIEQDYYFVLGDSRHYSADSRFWGFVPADHVVGRAAFLLLSSAQGASGPRWGRAMKGL